MIPRSWTGPVAVLYGQRRRVSECARCELVLPLMARGLCNTCVARCQDDGTLAAYGYVKADRMADYAHRRRNGDTIGLAASRLGISRRTAERYEAELAVSGRAPWRQWPGAAVRRAA